MSNSDNPRIGAEFQRKVRDWFSDEYNMTFNLEVQIPIGSKLFDPSQYKDHKFDIVSEDGVYVIECKRYTWTVSGNVPSAKMGFANEAAFYLSLLDQSHKKFIVMYKSPNEKRGMTLAEYYYHTNKHLLGDVIVAEFDPQNSTMRFINETEVYALLKSRRT